MSSKKNTESGSIDKSNESAPAETDESLDALSKEEMLQALLDDEDVDEDLLAELLADESEESESSDTNPTFPLSFAQQRLWFIDKFEAGSALYNLPLAVEIEGNLDLDALEKAFKQIIKRHEMLRSLFLEVDGEPVQQVQRDGCEQWACVRESLQLEPQHRDRVLSFKVKKEALTPFNLAEEFPIRVKLFAVSTPASSKCSHVIVVTLHHIAADGWSFNNLFIELLQGYRHFAFQAEQNLPELEIQYGDFADWQREHFSGDKLQQEMDYWLQQLESLPVLELPTKVPRPAKLSAEGDVQAWEFDKSLLTSVREKAKRSQTSVFNVLLAAFASLLTHYSRQSDFAVGIPVAGRNDKNLEPLIGFFINSLAIRVAITPGMTVDQLIDQVKETTSKAYSFQTLPFEQIVAQLELDRGGSNTPLFQVMFSLQNAPEAAELLTGDIGIGDLRFNPLNADSDVAKYDLVCNLRETPRGLTGGFSYRSKLFAGQWIEALKENFALVLQQVVANGDSEIADLDITSKHQLGSLTRGLTGDHLALPLQQDFSVLSSGPSLKGSGQQDIDFVSRFIRLAEENPEQIALVEGEKEFSYGQLNEMSQRLANWLQERQVAAQALVPVISTRGYCQLVCYLGVLKTGAAYVAIDPKQPVERQDFILADTNANLALVQEGLSDSITGSPIAKQISEEFLADLTPVSDSFKAKPIADNDLVYTIYTSGSTGQPKGVLIERHGLENLICWHQQAYEVTAQSKATLLAGEGFDASVWEIWPYLCAGATLVVVGDEERLQVDLLANSIQLNGITHSFMPTPLAEAFLQLADLHGESSLQYLLTGGDALSIWPSEQQQFRLFNHYGPTEATVVATAGEVLAGGFLVDGEPNAVPSIGRPIDNIRLHILNEKLNPVPRGVFGELCIEGVSLARGYLNRSDEEKERFVSVSIDGQSARLYRTGDLVSLDQEGQIHFHGRIDQQVKIRGYRIELGEIMAQLNSLALVSESVVIVDSSDSGQDRLVAYCVLVPGATVDSNVTLSLLVKQHLEGKLPSYMVPEFSVEIPTVPLTVNGKVDRAQLPSIENLLTSNQQTLAPLNGAREEELAQLWSEVLGLSSDQVFSREQNFFELGGHSLSAAKLVTELENRYAVSLSLKTFFNDATIAQLSQMIDIAPAESGGSSTSVITPAAQQNDYPLSFVQQRLWYVLELNPNSTAYNMPMTLELKGRVNLNALEQAVAELVQRHHILRSNIKINANGEPRLNILEACAVDNLNVEQCANLDEKHWQKKVLARTKQNRLHLFNPEQGPLFFCDLLFLDKGAQSELVMNVVFHHLISDGWSVAVFFRELAQLYSAFDHHDTSPLADLQLQYHDYTVWQRQTVETPEEQNRVVSFWVEQLSDAHRVLELTPDKPRQQALLHIADHVYFELDDVESAQFQQLCQRMQLTPFMLLLAAYQLTLSKHTGQKDVCVGIPLSGRDNSQLHPLIGYFINGLVVRSRFEDNPCVEGFLEQVKNTVLEVFENQDVPTQLLFEKLQLVRSGGELPGQRNTFAFQNFADRSELEALNHLSTPDLEIELKGATELQAKQDLALVCYEQDGRIKGSLEFDTDLFHRETIEQFCSHLRWILRQCISESEKPVDALAVVDQDTLLEILNSEQKYEQILPLTAIQRDILLSGLVEVESHKNNLGFAGIINVPLDFEKVKLAVDQVVAQQALLRGEFIESRHNYLDDAYFAIRKTVDYQVHLEDLRDQDISEEDCQAIAERYIFYPYQLLGESRTELLRFNFFQLADDKYLFVISDHHSLLDGVGNFLMAGYFISTYLALITGGQAPVVIDNFAEYVAFDRQLTDRSDTIQFWREQSQGVEPLTFPKINLQQLNGVDGNGAQSVGRKVSKQLVIEDAEVQAIKLYCKRMRITPALYFKALYAFVLQAYCNAESDFFLSELVAGRPKGHHASLGCYYQQLPAIFKIDHFSNESDVTNLFKSVKAFQKKIKRHHNISIFAQRRELVHGPVSFMYNYNPFLEEVSFMGEAHKNLGFVPDVEDQVQLHLKNVGEGLHLNLYYYDNQFEDYELLQRLASVSRQLLAGADKIGELSLLLPSEQNGKNGKGQLDGSRLVGGRLTGTDFGSLAQWLEHSFTQFDNNTAVQILGDDGSVASSLSYAQLYERVKTTSALLQSQGVNCGDRVALVLNRSLEFMTTLLSLVRLGAVYIPIDPQYPEERIAFIAEDSGAKWIIADTQLDKPLSLQPGLAQLSLEMLSGAAGSTVSIEPYCGGGEDEFYLIYTSGTTGKPKGSIVLQQGVLNLQQWYIDEMNFDESDHHLVISAIGFDLTQKNLFAPLLSGGSILFPESSLYDAPQLLQQIDRQKVSRINCAPSAIYPIIDAAGDACSLDSLRTLVLGGEVIQASLLHGLPDTAQVYNSYGPTECTDISAFHKLTQEELKGETEILLGRPNAGVNLEVRSVSGQLLPKQMLGELWVEGVSVGKGYWQQEELTAQKFAAEGERRYYKTGDLVRLASVSGVEQLNYVGRKDFQIKWRGFRIELAEIELSLIEVKEIKQALVMLKESEGRQRLVAYVLTDAAIDEQQVRHSLKAFLADYMIPDLIIPLQQWPLTANGKIDRAALPAPETLLKEKHIKQPRNGTEQAVWDIWREVLGVEAFGVDESFFDLGGHSLLANQINARIRKKFQIELSLRDFIDTPTVAGVAAAINRLQLQGEDGLPTRPVLTARPVDENTLPLSYQQERLWYLQKMVPHSNAYHMPLALMVTGELNLSALQKGLMQLINKHESLRTSFVDELGVPQQRVWESNELPWVERNDAQLIDVTDIEVSAADETTIREQPEVVKFFQEAFDLASGPLIKLKVVNLSVKGTSAKHWMLLANMHHIVADGWSLNILLRDLLVAYAAARKNADLDLPPLAIDYGDFSRWQREYLKGEVLARKVNFWVDYLRQAPTRINIYPDRIKPAAPTDPGGFVVFEFNEELTARLQKIGVTHNRTLFTVLLGCYQLFLAKYSGDTDLTLAVPNAGRDQLELEGIIGFFVNAVLVRSKIDVDQGLIGHLDQLQENVSQVFAHQDAPVHLVMEALNLNGREGAALGAQLGFSLQTTQNSQSNFDTFSSETAAAWMSQFGLDDIKPIALKDQSAKTELGLAMSEQQGVLKGVFEYNKSLFDEITVQRIAELFKDFVAQLVVEDAPALRAMQLYTAAELAEKVGVEPVLSLTAMQRDMLLENLISPNSLQSSHGFAVQLNQSVDVDLFRRSVDWVVNQTPAMKLKFYSGFGRGSEFYYQSVSERTEIPFEFRDWSDVAGPDWSIYTDEVAAAVNEFVYRPYDALNDELSSYLIIKLGDERYVCICACHHALADGMGLSAHSQHLAMNYLSLANGNDLMPVASGFEQYIANNAGVMDQPETLAFWRNAFSEVEPLELGAQVMAPARIEKKTQSLTLDQSNVFAVKAFCKQQRITPALYFKCLYAILIRSYTRSRSDFIVYEALNGRSKAESFDVGCFIQQLPVVFGANSFASDNTLKEFFAAARSFQRSTKRHQNFSVGEQNKLSPLGRIGFNYNYYHFIETIEFLGEQHLNQGLPSELRNQVQLLVKDVGSELCLDLVYYTDVFDDDRFLERLLSCHEQIVAGLEKLGELSLFIDDAERSFVENATSGLQQAFDSSLGLHHYFEKAVLSHANDIAVIDDEVELNYQTLNAQANQIAHYLLDSQQEAPVVAVYCHRSSLMLAAILGVLKAGKAYLPIDASYPSDRVEYMLQQSDVGCVLSQSALTDQLQGQEGLDVLTVDTWLKTKAELFDTANPDQPFDLAQPAYLLYTSGSTGKPKGAVIPHRGAVNHILAEFVDLQVFGQFNFLQSAPASSDISVWQFLAPLFTGGTVVVLDDVANAEKCFTLLKQHDVHLAELVPVALTNFLDYTAKLSAPDLPYLRHMMATGERVPVSLVNRWLSQYPSIPVVNAYGPTEASDDVTQVTIAEPLSAKYSQVPIGKPLNNITVEVVDDHFNPLPPGLPGELLVSGIAVAQGYWEDKEKTQQAFIEVNRGDSTVRAYRTGDLGVLANDGELYCLGRVDQQIKLRGYRIELEEVEAVFSEFDQVASASVILKEDEHRGPYLAAYLIPTALKGMDRNTFSADIKALAATRLPPFMMPSFIAVMEAFPLTPAGKIDRKRLPEAVDLLPEKVYLPPLTATEIHLADIWRQLFGVEKISRDDNFFELGGHSILAVRLFAMIEQSMGIKLSVSLLFQYQVLEQLATVIDLYTQRETAWSALRELHVDENKPLMLLVHPLNGQLVSYHPLAKLLSEQFSIYGLEARGLAQGELYVNLEEMVSDYISALDGAGLLEGSRRISLLGQSLGGLLAIALGQELGKRGVQLERIILLDTFLPEHILDPEDESALIDRIPEQLLPIPKAQLKAMPAEERLSLLLDLAKQSGLVADEFSLELLEKQLGMAKNNVVLARQVSVVEKLKDFTGKLLHIAAEERALEMASENGWLELNSETVFETTPGNHESLLQSPQVETLHAKLLTLMRS